MNSQTWLQDQAYRPQTTKPWSNQPIINSDVINHSVLADVIYSATDLNLPSYVSINNRLSQPDVIKAIGSGWRVSQLNDGRYLSTHDTAVIENASLKIAILTCRGTDFEGNIIRDFLLNDIGGFIGIGGSRVETTLVKLGLDAKTYCQEKGYLLSSTGHSLGGSVASAVAGILGIPTYTFNAPELRHSLGGEYASGRENIPAYHFKLDKDMVAYLGGRPFLDRGKTFVIPFKGNSYEAHLQVNVRNRLEQFAKGIPSEPNGSSPFVASTDPRTVRESGFYGGSSWSNDTETVEYYGHFTTAGDKSESSSSIPLILIASQQVAMPIYSTSGSVHLDCIRVINEQREGNLFVTKTVQQEVVLDANSNKVLSQQIGVTDYAPSVHCEAAVRSARIAVANGVVNSLISKNSHLSVRQLGKTAAEVGVRSFAASALASHLNHHVLNSANVPSGVGRLISQGGVEAAFSLLHGDVAAARKASLDSLANSALLAATGIPVSIHRDYYVSTAGMLGCDIIYSNERIDTLGLSLPSAGGLNELLGGVSIGVFHNRVTDVYRKNGFVIHREADGFGLSGRMSVFSASLGVYNGVEYYNPRTTSYIDSVGLEITRTESGYRTFQGELGFRAGAGDRLFSKPLLPAWKYLNHLEWMEWRSDGKPLLEANGLKNQILSPVTDPSLNEQLLPSLAEVMEAHKTGSVMGDTDSTQIGTFNQHNAQSTPNSENTQSVTAQTTDGFGALLDQSPSVITIEQPSIIIPIEDNSQGATVNIKFSCGVQKSFHRSRYDQQQQDQGRSETVDCRGGTQDKSSKYFGLSSSKSSQDYSYGTIKEATASQSAAVDVEHNRIYLQSTRDEIEQLYVDTMRTQTIKRRWYGRKRTETHYFKPGERRELGQRTHTQFNQNSEMTADGTELFSRPEYISGDSKVVERIYEKFQAATKVNDQLSNEFHTEDGIKSTTTQHQKDLISDDGLVSITQSIADVSHDAFSDTMYEYQDGQVQNYGAGEKREELGHVGDDRTVHQVELKIDGSKFLSESLGVKSLNGINGIVNFDVNRYDTDSFESKDSTAGESTSQYQEKRYASGVYSLGEAGEIESHIPHVGEKLYGNDAKMTHQVNISAYGYASSLVRDVDTIADRNVNYREGSHDLQLEAKALVRQTIVTSVFDDGCKISHAVVERAGGQDSTTDYVFRRDDVLTETFDISATPNANVKDIANASIENGGIGDADTITKVHFDATTSRNRYEGGGRVMTSLDSSSTNMDLHNLFTGESTVVYESSTYALQIEKKIDSGYGDNAKVSDEKITVGSLVDRTHSETKTHRGYLTTVVKTTETHEVTGKKPTTSTTSSVKASGGLSGATGAAFGALAQMGTNYVAEGKIPTRKEGAMALINVAESYGVGQATEIMLASNNLAVGIPLIAGGAAIVAAVKAYVDDENPDGTKKTTEDKVVDIAGSVLSSGAQAFAASVPVAQLPGGGTIVAIPVLIDCLKCGYSICRGRKTWSECKDKLVDNGARLFGGFMASSSSTWAVRSLLNTSLATAGFGVGLGLTAVGSVGFVIGAYTVSSIVRASLKKDKERKARKVKEKRVKEIMNKYELSGLSEKEDFDRSRRWLLKKCHTDKKSGNKELFTEIANDFDELYKLNVELKRWKPYEENGNGGKILSHSSYILSVICYIRQFFESNETLDSESFKKVQYLLSDEYEQVRQTPLEVIQS